MEIKHLVNKRLKYKQLLWLGVLIIFSLVLFEKIYLLQPYFGKIMSVSVYLSWHTLLEYASIIISVCIFLIPYYAYQQHRRLRGIVIANIFLIMSIIDMFHTLSYKGMPFFLIENNTANRATTFWIISRLVGALGFVTVTLIKMNQKSRIDRRVFSGISVALTLIILGVVTYFPDLLPAMYIEGKGVTALKKILEYAIILLLIFAGARYFVQYLNKEDKISYMFVMAVIFSVFSELAFVRYYSVYDINNYLGHIYKFISYYIVFRAVFINNIQKPYLQLFEAKKELKASERNLNLLVTERTKELSEKNQKLLRDLEYAREIQKAMIPDKLPNSDKVVFEAGYYPAERVSGDFYNIFRLDEHRIGMYIGDVSGHGVPASMLTVFSYQSIKTTRELEGNRFEIIRPAKVLMNLYELYNNAHFMNDVYILVLYAIFDTRTNELIYSSAGMNAQPLIVKQSGIWEMDIRGLPICNLMDLCKADYTDKTIQLEKGDRIFFYSDGLVELNNKQTGEYFSLENLKNILTENHGRNSADVCLEIDKQIRNFADEGSLKDDVTYFMLQVN